MKLYHFCRVSDLESIAEKGLYPHVPTEPAMSLGEEVVWLTTQETTEVDETDIEHFHHLSLSSGDRTDGSERLAVRYGQDASSYGSHSLWAGLRNYGEWLQSNADVVM